MGNPLEQNVVEHGIDNRIPNALFDKAMSEPGLDKYRMEKLEKKVMLDFFIESGWLLYHDETDPTIKMNLHIAVTAMQEKRNLLRV